MRHLTSTLVLLALAGAPRTQTSRTAGLPDLPAWGRGPITPEAANALFATGNGCAMCHSLGANAKALRTTAGEDASPHGLWRGSVMANSFRDPFWRAQVAREIAAAATPQAARATQALCLTCHGPMVHHTARVAGEPSPAVAVAAQDALARDGVSCTVCHQARADGLGEAASFAGNLDIRPERVIYGPYADPFPGPMRMHSAFTPRHGAHVQGAALCGACHTLHTTDHPGATPFPEQTPYLEWRNSEFSDEGGKAGPTSRTCQQCHMADLGTMKIARNPGGRDFPMIGEREHVRGHEFVGGNAFLLDLLRHNRDALGVQAPAEVLARTAAATRTLLREQTASLALDGLRRDGDQLAFTVTVANRTGHKLPTAYPSRRVWLRLEVRAGDAVVFESGAWTKDGRIAGVADERAIPHRDLVERPEHVVVYEAVPVDDAGKPTTQLTRMVRMGKDSRLLPRGWKRDGPHAAELAPQGVDGDPDWAPGSDQVHVHIRVGEAAKGPVTVTAWLCYQSIPPAWVEALRTVDAPEARTFVTLYDAADKTPEVLAKVSKGL